MALLQLIIGKGTVDTKTAMCEGMSLRTAWAVREKGCDLRQSAVYRMLSIQFYCLLC